MEPLRRVISRVRRMLRSWLFDVALAVVLAVFVAFDVATTADWPEPRAASAVLAVLSAASLAARRIWPLTSFAGALGGLAAVYVALGHYETGSSVLIALVATYSAAAYGRNLPFVLAVVAGFSATAGLRQPPGEAVADFVWTFVALSLPLAVGFTARRLRGQAELAEEQARALEQEQIERAEAAAERERKRIARELHDLLNHSLSVLILQAGAAEQVVDSDPGKAREALAVLRATGQEALDELGRLVGLIRDDSSLDRAPQPTLADLDRMVNAARAGGVAIQMRIEGEVRRLPAAVELNAYRVVQEGITNALKHARGTDVTVLLKYGDDGIEIEVTDTAASSSVATGSRHGLIGLRERVAVFGGELHAGPQPGGGWTMRAWIPVAR